MTRSHNGLQGGDKPTASDPDAAPTLPVADQRGVADSHLELGDVLADRYLVESFVARGGMGEVYRARDMELGVSIALKTIRTEVASDPGALRQFKQEVLLARSVSHPNVCRVFDLGRHRDETRDVVFLTMEFLPGETLAARIRSRGRIATQEGLPIVRQLADALDTAHHAGIVHRDFKSANVMIVPSPSGERAVITDFGLALPIQMPGTPRSAPESVALLGTPAYMAPEQVSGGRIGPAADLYSLGVVLFEMATGTVPFHGSTPMETAQARLRQDPPRPSSLAEVGPAWDEAILRLLAREPHERFPHARDVVAALEGRPGAAVTYPRMLPPERDPFVGRSRELQELARRLEAGSALVTVLGAGGTGKSRLACRYGWNALERWPGGVWFCDLTEARAIDGIVRAVAVGLDVPLGKGDPIAQLGHAIAGHGRALIILDNFEQVSEHAPATLGRWVARSPDTAFLVTSRQRLGLAGETTVELDPLAPEAEGVELFAQRAQVQRSDFALTDANRSLVAEIVRLLDGLPLAIELAAARLRALSLEQLRARLADRLSLLAGPKPGRHRTLRATLDWSWELLGGWEQAAVAQAAVFDGGFTLEAAEAVLDLAPWPDAPPVLDVVQALIDKCWFRARVVLDAPRFEMLSSLRDYAAEKLRTESAIAGPGMVDAGRRCEQRHGEYFARFGASDALEALDRHGGVASRKILEVELDNVVSACRRAVERGDGETAVRALAAAWGVLGLRGPFAAAIDLGAAVLAIPGLEAEARARALRELASALWRAGRMEDARQYYEEALALHREVGDRLGEGAALGNRRAEGIVLNSLANLYKNRGRMDEARRLYEEALALHREGGDRLDEGAVLGNLGILHFNQGRMEEAQRHYEQALAIYREVGGRRYESTVLSNLGVLHWGQGRIEEARRFFEAALAIDREVGDRLTEGIVLGNLGVLHQEQGRLEEARRLFEAALTIHREVGSRRQEAAIVANLSNLHLDQGRTDDARRLGEQALAIYREVGDRRSEGILLGNLGNLHLDQGRMEDARRLYEMALSIHREVGNHATEGAVLGRLGELEARGMRFAEARVALARGEALLRGVDDRLELAKLLCTRGECERLAGEPAAARAALSEAESLAETVGAGPDSELGRMLAGLRGRVVGGAQGSR